jgi:hypothetical protein
MRTICVYLLLFAPVLLHLLVMLKKTGARHKRRMISGSDRAEMRERAMHSQLKKKSEKHSSL